MRASNNRFQRDANLAVAARAVWREAGLPRVEIARALGLYRSTVGNLVGALMEAGLLVEAGAGEATPRGGRKPVALDLNPGFGLVLGLDLSPGGYRGVLCELRGGVKARLSGSGAKSGLPRASEPLGLVELALADARAQADALGLPLIGVCAGMPGIVDPLDGVIVESRAFGLRDYPFVREAAARCDLPVIVENDANCCAWDRLVRGRADRLSHFICLLARYHPRGKGSRAGMGVGLGLALDGRVHYGYRFAAGEFASLGRREGSAWQLGLDDGTMERTAKDPEAFADFVEELFRGLVPVLFAFSPEAVFVHGELKRREAEVRSSLEARLPVFSRLLSERGAQVHFVGDGDFDVAEGAAAAFLARLFTVPELSGLGARLPIPWELVFRARSAALAAQSSGARDAVAATDPVAKPAGAARGRAASRIAAGKE